MNRSFETQSGKPPDPPQNYHHLLTLPAAPPAPFSARAVWAKADMVATVGFARLDLFRTPRPPYSRRRDIRIRVDDADLAAVRACVGRALGLLT